MYREDFILARDKAYVNLEKLKIKYNETKQLDLEEYENAVREYHLRMAALRMFEIYHKKSEENAGKWSTGEHFVYYNCADMLNQMADLGDTFYDVKNTE